MDNNLIIEKTQLSEAKRLLLEKRLQGKKKKPLPIEEIPRRQEGNTPLSYTQERLWFVYGLDPTSSAYNVPLLLRFKGSLNINVLEKSIDEVIKRHESLRTNFKNIDGQPIQIISDETRFALSKIDLRGSSVAIKEGSKESEAKRIIQSEVDKPFDLANDLLIRACLIRVEDDENLLILNVQHIVFDGWSIDIFFKELAIIYEALTSGKEFSLPELKIQYADYAVWQRNWLKGKEYKKLLEFWKSQLADAPSIIGLPTDHPRPRIQTYVGKTNPLKLPYSLYKGLRALSQREGVTLYMTLLATFKVLLYRYSGQEDFTIGTFIASRNKMEIENLIGFFANTLVMRTDLTGSPTFKELLKRVREVSLNAHAHQDMPFEKLVEELQPQRNFSYTPLFQVMFDLQNEQVAKIENLTINSLPVHHSASKFDLSLVFDELSEGLIANIEYNTDLFDENTIDRMLSHLQTLLEGIVSNPEKRISEFPLVSETKSESKFLIESNNTRKEYPSNQLIHTLFEEQAIKTPDAVAFVFEGKKITYKELNERANQLSHYIKKLGIETESLVGIYVERSIEMIIGILAVLKAGGAYVPLDPAYPKDRIFYMLKDSNVKVLLTQEKLLEGLPEHSADVILLGPDFEKISSEEKDNPSNKVFTENIFNVIYTSGSTAKPKGVLGLHKSALNRFNWMWEKYPFSKVEVCCQKTALSFVDSIWEIFGPLLNGVSNVIIPDDILIDPNLLIESLAKNNVTRIVLVPSLLNVILDSVNDLKNKLPKLKYWFISGEALSKELAQRFEELMPHGLLINLYGSSEVAADVTCYEVKDSKSLTCIPIGKPIANTQIYILDKHLNPVPIGVVGELYVGGNNLARGYLNQFEMTSEKFICNPFGSNEGERFYKTGDLARFLSDGNIEYRGRVDHQVKIRGFRIELQEIETVLEENPQVKNCIVEAKEYEQEDKRLIAYVIPNSNVINSEQDEISKLSEEKSSEWQTVWDETYKQSSTEDKTFNIIGWNSSYTGKPIPENEMRVWVESTVERILSLKPKRVLEIGCGTGMLLFRVAPQCDKYVGTDISHEAINYLNEQLQSSKYSLPQVELLEKKAEDFSDFEKNSFDAVVINSVVQYFPNIEYLLNVLEKAVDVVAPGGAIFIGDVRSLPLLETFHTSVQLHQSPPKISIEELKIRIEKNVDQEKELVVDQSFFNDLKYNFPKIGYVDIQPKRGKNLNEVTCYRYDVTIHIEEYRNFNEANSLDWKKQSLNLDRVNKLLSETKPEILKINRVPNARIIRDVKAWELIRNSDGLHFVDELQEKLDNLNFSYAIEPEDFWKFENELPYNVKVSWTNMNSDGSYDIIFERKDLISRNGLLQDAASDESSKSMKSLSQYANNPIHQDIARNLIPRLRSYVQEKLPEYMIPSAFVVMENFPFTPNGKINRRALPLPEYKISLKENEYVEPNDELEYKLTIIWEKLLDVKPIGIKDNFFGLGGHSLMAVRLFAQIEKIFDKKLPLATLYQAQTIEELAKIIRDEGWKPLWSSLVPIQTNGSRPPFFIVHGGGGNVLFCKNLINYLDPEQPVYGLQSVGLDRSVPPLTRVEDMAEHYVKEIQIVQPEGPYYLAGNCFGGLITFEMARNLQGKGQKVAMLVLIEAYNPGFKELLPSLLKQQVNDFKMEGFESVFKKIIWKISYYFFKAINKPLPPLLRSVIRANHKAYDDYRPKFYPDKITLFIARRSPAWNMPKPVFGWEKLTDKELEVYKIPGGHLNIFEKHNIADLAVNLKACIEKAMSEQATEKN